MRQFDRSWSVVTAVLAILVFVTLPASAATPPFLGPPNMHAYTLPGLVDVNGTDLNAYPEWLGLSTYYLQSPWEQCRGGDWSYRIYAYKDSGPKYVRFQNMARTFTVDQFDAGYPIGGTYQGWWDTERGTLTLEKSVAGQETYDQVHLVGTKRSGAVNVILSLVEQDSYIGVANLASVAGIKTCAATGANANSQIMLPLGTGDHGQPTIILDINGDGRPDDDFLQGPPLSGSAAPPIPTLTEWGLIAMTLILLIVGLRFFRNNASPLSA